MASGLAPFLTKKIGDLPVWAWGLIGAAGVGVGIIIIKKTSTSAAAIPTAPTANAQGVLSSPIGDNTGMPTVATVAGQVPPNVNQNSAQTTPPGPGYVPIINSNGDIVGWQFGPVPPAPPPTPAPNPTPPVPPAPPPVTPPTHFVNPLIPYSVTWSGNHYFPVAPGHVFGYQWVNYWIISNTGGVITGVPGAASASQAAGKAAVTLYAPQTYYH